MKIKLTIDGTTAFKAEIRPEAFADAMVDLAPHMTKIVEAYSTAMVESAPALAAMTTALEDAMQDAMPDAGTDTCYAGNCGKSFPDPDGSRLYCDDHECSNPDCDGLRMKNSRFCHRHSAAVIVDAHEDPSGGLQQTLDGLSELSKIMSDLGTVTAIENPFERGTQLTELRHRLEALKTS